MRAQPAILGGILAPAVVALWALLFLPQLISVLAHVDRLPWLSRAMLSTYQGWLALPVMMVALLVATGWHRTRPRQVLSAGIVMAAGLFALAIGGLYAPIVALAYG